MSIWDILFPKRCVGCGRLGRYFCPTCIETLPVITASDTTCPMCLCHAIDGVTHLKCKTRFGIDGLTSACFYKGQIKHAIRTIKYRGVYDIAHEFLTTIPKYTLGRAPKVDVIIPVPLYRSRQFLRGFNQAEVIARLLGQKLNIPLRTDILRRIKYTRAQASLRGRSARTTNVSGVFWATHDVRGLRVMLVDDVFTTGATAREAAQMLKRSGATMVWMFTLAR